MTVSTTQNRITYNGNGITTVYSFPYKFIETTDLQVYVNGDLLVEDVDYTVGVPSDSGADITFNVAPSSALSNVVILRDPNLLQDTDLPTNGRLPADAIERMVDKVTLVAQRLRDLLDRTIRRNDADPANSTLVLPVAVANKALIFDQDGNLGVGVDDYIDQANNAALSASIASNAADSAFAVYDEFDDRYLGSKASDPTLDNDGQALLTGALYWNSTTNKLRIYNGSAWQDTATATPASFTSNVFSGTGAQTAFTLSTTPASSASVVVSVSGVLQRPTTDYSVSGTTLTFVAAPPLDTNNVLALVASTVAAGTPDNDSVSTAKIQNDAVTAEKIAAGAVGSSELASTTVTPGTYGSATEVAQFTVDADGRLTSANSIPLSSSGALIGYQIFTSSGSYVKATNNPTFVIVEVQGGGGNGGGVGASAGGAGAGGGAGGYSQEKIPASSLAASETVTVGAAGGTSSFGSFCSATGGSVGASGSASSCSQGGAGGTGSGGDYNSDGSGGSAGVGGTGSTSAAGGSGGSSRFGGAGRGRAGAAGSGFAAVANTGSGGGGGASGGAAVGGGAGGTGVVIVWEYR